ncbi:MAG: T9SS type A sorting domain-containing protein [Bacteroidetes bacterium]|nr:T9SS type A sorting domain-containing protein [Bacteroidota bacterium]
MKIVLQLLVICCLAFPAKAQQFLSINPNFANSGQSLNTTVTSEFFYFTQGSSPGQFWQDFYMYQGNYIIFPNFVNVVDDDHLEVSWSIPTAAPSGNYEVVWDISFGGYLFPIPGGFNINCIPTQGVIAPPSIRYICPGSSTILTANAGTGFTYQWYKNNALIQGATLQSYSATSSGSYQVRITNAQGCPDLSDPVNVYNASVPNAIISSPSTNIMVCPNQIVTLGTNSGFGYTYQWFKSGVLLNGSTSQFLTISDSGSYTVRITNNQGCSNTSQPRVITWASLPVASITTSTGNPGFCSGSTVGLSTPPTAGNTYKWYKYGNLIAGATSSTYQASTAGKYKVVVTNSTGCSKTSAPLTISLYPIPPATISATGPTTFCQGNQVKLQANYGSTYSYQWYKYGNAIPGETSRNLFANSTGPYKVEVTSAYGCSKKSTATNVTVLGTPAATITPNGPTTFCAGGSVLLKGPNGTGYTYQWKLMGNDIAGATNKNYTATFAGNYKVAVTNSLGCTDISDPVTVTIPCRMKNEMLTENLELFPNPANTFITISGGIPSSYEVINATGQVLISQEKNTANVIDISSIPAGLYLIRVVTENGPSTLKFIKEE